MTPDQLQQKEKARVVAIVAADDDFSSASPSRTAMEAPRTPSAPPLSAARTKTSFNSSSSSSGTKGAKRFSVFAAGASRASSASGARAASSAAADALRFYSQTLPTSLVFAAFMFCLYAATSYGLPHVLCKSSATDEVKGERNVFFSLRPFVGSSRRAGEKKRS
jgi:hypothetical protein